MQTKNPTTFPFNLKKKQQELFDLTALAIAQGVTTVLRDIQTSAENENSKPLTEHVLEAYIQYLDENRIEISDHRFFKTCAIFYKNLKITKL